MGPFCLSSPGREGPMAASTHGWPEGHRAQGLARPDPLPVRPQLRVCCLGSASTSPHPGSPRCVSSGS